MFSVGEKALEQLFVDGGIFASGLCVEETLLFAFAEKVKLVEPHRHFSVKLKPGVGAENCVPRGRPI